MTRAYGFFATILLLTGTAWASPEQATESLTSRELNMHSDGAHSVFQQDKNLEKNLRELADPDKVMTPRKALKWVRELTGMSSAGNENSPIEFRPDVKVKESNVRVIAAFAYKF